MDRQNLRQLSATVPPDRRESLRLLREFDPASNERDLEVPDPYMGGPEGFERVLDMIEAACRGLVDQLRTELG